MKRSPKLFASLWFLLLLLPVSVKADAVDDVKAEVTATLPPGSHQDKVRQFLKVRKFKITEEPKQKTISGRLVLPRNSSGGGMLVITFQFDDDHKLTNASYDVTNARS